MSAQQKLMNILQAAFAAPVIGSTHTKEIAEAVDETKDQYLIHLLAFFRLQEERLREHLAASMLALDKANLPDLQQFIQEFVNSYSSAHDARNNFTLKWFRQQMVSPEAKCKLARDLITATSAHLGSNVPAHWTALARNDQSYMNAVMYTFEDAQQQQQ